MMYKNGRLQGKGKKSDGLMKYMWLEKHASETEVFIANLKVFLIVFLKMYAFILAIPTYCWEVVVLVPPFGSNKLLADDDP